MTYTHIKVPTFCNNDKSLNLTFYSWVCKFSITLNNTVLIFQDLQLKSFLQNQNFLFLNFLTFGKCGISYQLCNMGCFRGASSK